MENLNAEQVKKALECCLTTSESDCIACAYKGKKDGLFITCTNCLMADALALINSQEQRIKELTEDKEKLGYLIDELVKEKRELWEENKKLTEENERLTRLANLRQRDLDNANDLLFKAEDENERLRAKKEHNAGNEKYILSTVMVAPIDYTLEEYRKRVYSKMEKYTVFGREYIQRIMREVAKEMLEGENEN